jgi:hypothetical protein
MEMEQIDVPLGEPLTKSIKKLWRGMRMILSLLPVCAQPDSSDTLSCSLSLSDSNLTLSSSKPSSYSLILSHNFENAIKKYLSNEFVLPYMRLSLHFNV